MFVANIATFRIVLTNAVEDFGLRLKQNVLEEVESVLYILRQGLISKQLGGVFLKLYQRFDPIEFVKRAVDARVSFQKTDPCGRI